MEGSVTNLALILNNSVEYIMQGVCLNRLPLRPSSLVSLIPVILDNILE